MLADCNDATFVDQHDSIGQCDGARAMRNDDGGSPLHHGAHGVANLVFLAGVDRTRCIVEHQHAWVGNDGTCNRHSLTLASAEREPALADRRVVSLGEPCDEVVCAGKSRSAFHRCHIRIGFGKGDVVSNGIVEQEGFFEHHTDVLTQFAYIELAQIDAVQRDAALFHVIKAQQEPNDRALARTGGTHQRNRLPRCDGDTHTVEHFVHVSVPEYDVFERHRAHRLGCVSSRK